MGGSLSKIADTSSFSGEKPKISIAFANGRKGEERRLCLRDQNRRERPS